MDKPYTLTVEYYQPTSRLGVSPVLGGSGGFSLYNETILVQNLTKRYKTKKDVTHEIKEVNPLMKNSQTFTLE